MWAGLQHLCVEQGTCPGSLEQAMAQNASDCMPARALSACQAQAL